jgi:hypothetical protein
MKKVLFVILMVMVSVNFYAQEEFTTEKPTKITRYGIKTALCMSRFHNTHQYDIGINDIYSNQTGFSGGYYMDAMGNSGHYSTQFGIQYAGMGTKIDALGAKVRLHYIQLPLTFNVKAGYKFINVFLGGGIYGSATFIGKAEMSDLQTGEQVVNEEILSMPAASEDKLKPYHYFDSGIIYGGGLEFVLPNEHAIQLGLHF